jgi:hypothetical protein
MSTPPNDLDKLPWLERLNRVVDDEIAVGKPGWAVTYIVPALIRALHEKGVLSSQERDAVFAAWDRLEAFHREASDKEMKALREQYPELAGSVLGSSDPP